MFVAKAPGLLMQQGQNTLGWNVNDWQQLKMLQIVKKICA
jgi:hypothetical protein